MAEYITRVELHNETAGDYPKLHAEMEKLGFTRTIAASSTRYHLPDATYIKTTEDSPRAIYEAALAAVKAIGRKAGIIVAQSDYANMWVGGLMPV